MHCCNWAVLSSITCVLVSSRRPRKALSEADSPVSSPMPRARSYMVPGAVTKSPHLLSLKQTRRASDTFALDAGVATHGAASDAGQPEHGEHEPDDADRDSDPRDDEEEDEADDDECDSYADHEGTVPAAALPETSADQA